MPVELADGLCGEGLIGELDEAEPAGLAGVAVGDDRSRGDVPLVGEQRPEVGLGRAEWEIPNKDVHRHMPLRTKNDCRSSRSCSGTDRAGVWSENEKGAKSPPKQLS